jgi:hypothetical protein
MTLAAGSSAERMEELLTGPLTAAVLEETASILSAWSQQGLPPDGAERLRRIGALLDGAGNWITGWQACVEDLRARQMPEGESAWAYSGR